MKNILLLIIVSTLFSCKKDINLSETHWTVYFKHNSTFNYYAVSEFYFKNNDSVYNYRNFDTIKGRWILNNKKLNIDFLNDDKYEGNVVSSDSISGALLLPSGDHGVWYAKRK